MQVSHSIDSEHFDRIDSLAQTANKSRSLVISEIVNIGVPILEEVARDREDS